MMIVISTQVYENYGAHDWDGKGECPQYWKAKGGHEYKVLNIEDVLDRDLDQEDPFTQIYIDRVVGAVSEQCEQHNEYYREHIIGVSLEADDYLSWFEKSQLEYDGEIRHPEPVLEYGLAA